MTAAVVTTLREESIIGALLEANGDPIGPELTRLLQHAPESFDDQRAGILAASIHAMQREGQPVNVVSIRERIEKHSHADVVGDYVSLACLGAVSPELAEFEAGPVWKRFQLRKAKQYLDGAIAELDRQPDMVGAILSVTQRGLADLIDAEEKPGGLPSLIDAAQFIQSEIPQPAELVSGILHKGSKLAFGGSSKSFKTWTLLDLALSVATGTDWLGRATAQGKVLFVNFEVQPHAWQRRLVAVAQEKQIKIVGGTIQLWNLRGHGADFRTLIPKIIETARAEHFALVILDPIYKLYGGTDENAAGDVAALLNSVEKLSTETGAAVAFGAHFAKGNAAGKEAIDRISGSGVFARDPDSLLIFTAHETEAAFTVEPILRNFPPVAPFAVRWQFPLMRLAADLDPYKLKQTGGRTKTHDPEKLCAAIADSTAENPISVSAWAHTAGISRQTLQGYLSELRNKEWISTVGEGSTARQYLTENGREAARRYARGKP